jgi:molybdenum cofactor biosynthesis enzyme MoaA
MRVQIRNNRSGQNGIEEMRTEKLLKLNRLIRSPRLKFAGALAFDCLKLRHLVIRFDPVWACNIRCGMCYFSDENWLAANPVNRFSEEEIDRLAGMFLPQALQFHIGCGAEPTMYKNFPKLVALGKKYRVPFVGFTTNGQLLTAEKSSALVAEGLDEITISTHGVTRATYERLMKKASYDRYHQNLSNLVKAKRAANADNPHIRINYTVNPDNLQELRGFFSVFGDYDISTLQVRPIIDLGDTDYKNKNLAPLLENYDEIMDGLAEECHKRGVIFLANRNNVSYSNANSSSFVYEKAIVRFIKPGYVWREDFDWRNHTYAEHKRHIGYRSELLRYTVKLPKIASATSVAHEVY